MKLFNLSICTLIISTALITLFAGISVAQGDRPLLNTPIEGIEALIPDRNQQQTAEYENGKLIIKLKQGKTLQNISKLNQKHGVLTISRFFKDKPDHHKNLSQLKNRLAAKGNPSQKKNLSKKIKQKEKLIKRLEQRKKRAPKWAKRPKMDSIFLLMFPKDTNIIQLANEYTKHPAVSYAEPQYKAQDNFIPNDPHWDYSSPTWGWEHKDLYGLEIINASAAWDISTGRPDVIIAPIEDYMDITHEDLAGNIWANPGEIPANGIDDDNNGYVDDINGIKFSSATSYTTTIPSGGHGTHVAGTIAAIGNNGKGVIGVSWGSTIMPALGPDKASAIVYAVDNGADIITNSWSYKAVSSYVQDAIDYAHSQGCVVIASAGNNNAETLSQTPAQLENVITVAASDHLDQKASFSNYGIKIDVAAPGSIILSTYPNNTYGGLNGTSMSAPHVAGLAALIISRNLDLNEVNPEQYPLLTNEQIRQIIRKSADDIVDPFGNGGDYQGFDIFFGYGRINAQQALLQETACEANIFSPSANLTTYNTDVVQKGKFYFDGWTLVTDSIDVLGVASCNNFSGYTVEYGQGLHPQTWTMIASSNIPITGTSLDNTLVTSFDTNTLNNGTYTIKLTVTDSQGSTYEDRIMINVARALITNLPDRDESQGKEEILFFEPKEIRGYATGPGFLRYHLEYGIGASPSSWTRITADISTPVNNGQLFDAVDTPALPDGVITLKLVVEDSIVGTSEDSITILNDSLQFPSQQGFPINHPSTYSFATPVVADINRDGQKEIVFSSSTTSTGKIYAYDGAGQELWSVATSKPNRSALVAGDADNDPELEIAAKVVLTDSEQVYLFNHDGSILAGWPKLYPVNNYTYAEMIYGHSSPLFFDFDGDGQMEVVYSATAVDGGRIYIFKSDGTAFTGWNGGMSTGAPVVITPVVGDLDNDGTYEIVTRDKNNTLYVWSQSGQLLWSDTETGDFSYDCRIALADIDNDSFLEIISTTKSSTISLNGFSIWGHSGNKTFHPLIDTAHQYQYLTLYAFTLGDVDKNGSLDIIIPTIGYDSDTGYVFQLFTVNSDGTNHMNWPVPLTTDPFGGYPLIADVNNDGMNEVLISYYSKVVYEIVAIQANGIELTGDNWPIRKDGYFVSAMILDDLDGDNDLDLIYNGSSTKIRAWDLPAPYTPAAFPWSSFNGNSQNTGNYHQNSYYTLTADVTGAGSGAIASQYPGINCGGDCSENYTFGSQILLHATPDSNSIFSGWSGACNGTMDCQITIKQQTSVSANFLPDSDGDGVTDSLDVCPGGNDSIDTDNDTIPDFCDTCPFDNPDDTDGDGVCDSSDSCPGFNDAIDTDFDAIPDGCDHPNISTSPATYDYGILLTGSSSGTFFTISNTGTDPLIISNVTLADNDATAFNIDINNCGTVAEGDNCLIGISFTPDSGVSGVKTANLYILSNDPDNPPLFISANLYGTEDIDSDGDGVYDSEDAFPDNAFEWRDTDHDTIGDNLDNCPTVSNINQYDDDNDTLGNLCDNKPNRANYGSVMDAPHNEARGITCTTCHTYSMWWQYSPMEQDSGYGLHTDNICLNCHGIDEGAILAVHSSDAMGTSHRGTLDPWTSKCVDCHNPHEQEQVTEWSTSPDDNATLYLITGTFGDNSTFTPNLGQMTFDYTLVDINNPAWSDIATWANKDNTGYPNGLILVQDTANAVNTYEVISATSSTITVKGGIDPNEAAHGSFGLVYGRLIRSSIDTPNSGAKDVKFFDADLGSYVDLNIPTTGLCQVCHTQTYYWTTDGLNTGHFEGQICTDCHEHAQGFKTNEEDTEPPVITLLGSSSQTVECAGTYFEQGTTVTDNSSINLIASSSGTVDETTVGLYTLYYNVEDNAGNSADQLTRKIRVQDTTAPTIRLTGPSTVYVPLGGIYTEDNATASDTCGVSSPVSISGTVDTNIVGTYYINYNVLDDAENPAIQVTRTVEVVPADACSEHPSLAAPLHNSATIDSATFPDMEIEFSTKENAYDVNSACVPVFLKLTNTGTSPINLDATQASTLSSISASIVGTDANGGNTGDWLSHVSGNPIQPGLFLLPGESTHFSKVFTNYMEHIALYSVPPLGGGIVPLNLYARGPVQATYIVDPVNLNFTHDYDFGSLPGSRVYEPGAGVDFVADELIVDFNNGVTLSEAEAVISLYTCHILSTSRFNSMGNISVWIPFDTTTQEMITVFQSNPLVNYAERNYMVGIP